MSKFLIGSTLLAIASAGTLATYEISLRWSNQEDTTERTHMNRIHEEESKINSVNEENYDISNRENQKIISSTVNSKKSQINRYE